MHACLLRVSPRPPSGELYCSNYIHSTAPGARSRPRGWTVNRYIYMHVYTRVYIYVYYTRVSGTRHACMATISINLYNEFVHVRSMDIDRDRYPSRELFHID